MSDQLLYYPYINLPNNSWTIKSILYWDQVGIITPQQFIEYPERYDENTRALIQSGLVQQIFPTDYTYRVENFEQGFLRLFQRSLINLENRRWRFDIGDHTRIHIEKFGRRLMERLVELGVAEILNDEWYLVERLIADKIMLYLATFIAKLGNFTPATDKVAKLPNLSIVRKTWVHRRLIDELMPYPENASPTELYHFKDRYQGELKSFRLLIERLALQLSTIEDATIRDELIDAHINEINARKEQIAANLRPSFSKVSFGSICGLAGAVYGFSQNNHLMGIFSLANGIWSAAQGYDERAILANNYSYLALVDRRWPSAR
jgi:hypothetical protein